MKARCADPPEQTGRGTDHWSAKENAPKRHGQVSIAAARHGAIHRLSSLVAENKVVERSAKIALATIVIVLANSIAMYRT
jgi:hypothetical protein